MATEVSKAPDSVVDIQLLRAPGTFMSRMGRGFRNAFSRDNLVNMGERCLFLCLLFAVFTGYFIAFYFIAIAIRDQHGFMSLPSDEVDNNAPSTATPWMIVTQP